jgi:hypothetical protein
MKKDKKKAKKPLNRETPQPGKYEMGLPEDTRVVHSDEPNPGDGA